MDVQVFLGVHTPVRDRWQSTVEPYDLCLPTSRCLQISVSGIGIFRLWFSIGEQARTLEGENEEVLILLKIRGEFSMSDWWNFTGVVPCAVTPDLMEHDCRSR